MRSERKDLYGEKKETITGDSWKKKKGEGLRSLSVEHLSKTKLTQISKSSFEPSHCLCSV